MLLLPPNGLLDQHNTAPYSKTQDLNKQQNASSALVNVQDTNLLKMRMFVKRIIERINAGHHGRWAFYQRLERGKRGQG
jgi:hypothetical protein